MTGISSLASRNILACAISSAVLVVVSVFWFRKKRKIKKLPALGPSGMVKDISGSHCEKAVTLQSIDLNELVESVTDPELPPALQETSVKSTNSLSIVCVRSITPEISCTDLQPEIDDTMQVKDFDLDVGEVDSSAEPTCNDYVQQDEVIVLENSQEEVRSKPSINDCYSIPENSLVDSTPEHSENHEKCSVFTKDACLNATCEEEPVCDEKVFHEVGNSFDFSIEKQSLDVLNDVCLISENSSSPVKEKIVDCEDVASVKLSNSSLHENEVDCENVTKQSYSSLNEIDCGNVLTGKQPDSSTKNEEIVANEGIEIIKFSDSSTLNFVALPKNVDFAETEAHLPLLCLSRVDNDERSIEISEQVSFEMLSNFENSFNNKSEEGTLKAADVVAEHGKSESIVEENVEPEVNDCRDDEIKISNLDYETTGDDVEEI